MAFFMYKKLIRPVQCLTLSKNYLLNWYLHIKLLLAVDGRRSAIYADKREIHYRSL